LHEPSAQHQISLMGVLEVRVQDSALRIRVLKNVHSRFPLRERLHQLIRVRWVCLQQPVQVTSVLVDQCADAIPVIDHRESLVSLRLELEVPEGVPRHSQSILEIPERPIDSHQLIDFLLQLSGRLRLSLSQVLWSRSSLNVLSRRQTRVELSDLPFARCPANNAWAIAVHQRVKRDSLRIRVDELPSVDLTVERSQPPEPQDPFNLSLEIGRASCRERVYIAAGA